MRKATVRPEAPDGNTVALDAHALGTLRYIRASMDAARLLAVPGSAGVAMGAVGLAAAVLAARPALANYWLDIWLGASITALVSGSALMVHQATRASSALYRGPARRFLLCLTPPLAAGAVITFALWRHGVLDMIPGVWLLLYGCGVAAASTQTIRLVGVMGVAFAVLGVCALALPPTYGNLFLGAGFGGLHLTFGILIGWTRHER
ncbi:MAG TPA: hypothetical protein VEV18_07080 [Steroidobacteraceae bacterium]|nr:hypothetical protein [Steroidobacteraceae bacterium]